MAAQRKRVYEIDGVDFTSLEGFYDEISKKLIPNVAWGRNLDAFNDILRGGFGTPREGFVLRWKNSLPLSRTPRVSRNGSANFNHAWRSVTPITELRLPKIWRGPKAHEGKTAFDWLVEVVLVHCAGGAEQDDGVELDLC